MSRLSTDWTRPPFEIVRSAHVELGVTDLARSAGFYVDLLGLVVTEETDDALYLRGYEERLHHSLVLRAAPMPLLHHVSFRVSRPDDLDAVADHFAALGCPARRVDRDERGQGPALRVRDPLGFPVEFFYAMDHVECLLRRYDLHRGSRPMRLDHVNLFVPDVSSGYEHYRRLGFRCSEYIADDDDTLLAAWLYRKPTVHDVALTNGAGPRLHHFAYAMSDSAAITATCDVLGAAGYPIERGPGRHGVSDAFFLYLRDPDGHRVELYACDYYTGDPDHEPLRWSASDPRRRTFWGAETPDSWFDEGSHVLGDGGAYVEPSPSPVDERLVGAE